MKTAIEKNFNLNSEKEIQKVNGYSIYRITPITFEMGDAIISISEIFAITKNITLNFYYREDDTGEIAVLNASYIFHIKHENFPKRIIENLFICDKFKDKRINEPFILLNTIFEKYIKNHPDGKDNFAEYLFKNLPCLSVWFNNFKKGHEVFCSYLSKNYENSPKDLELYKRNVFTEDENLFKEQLKELANK